MNLMKKTAFFSTSSTVTYSEPWQTSKTGRFAKKVKGLKPLTNLVESSILDACLGSGYGSVEAL